MRNSSVSVFGLLLGSAGLVVTSCLFALEVCGDEYSKTEQFVKVGDLPHAGGRQGSKLSPTVQMQFMRPVQVEAAARRFPVVYVPFGCIEWHG